MELSGDKVEFGKRRVAQPGEIKPKTRYLKQRAWIEPTLIGLAAAILIGTLVVAS